MLEFEPTQMASVIQWLEQHGLALAIGVLIGSISTTATAAYKLFDYRRQGAFKPLPVSTK